MTACGGGSTSTEGGTSEASGKLKRSNETSLSNYFHQAIKQQSTRQYPLEASVNDSQASSGAVSGTNLQESGVDEADLIKTSSNGSTIYSVDQSNRFNLITGSVGFDDSPDADTTDTTVPDSDIIRIMNTQGAELSEVKQLSSSEQSWSISGLYLDNTEQHLIALSSHQNHYWDNWFNSPYFAAQTTDVLFFDVENPASASLSTTLSFDGSLIDSRRNGDTLYMVLRHYPDYIYTNDQNLETTTSGDFLPNYRINNTAEQAIVAANDCYVEEGQQGSADIITLVAINLASDTPQINSECYVGSAEALYASQNALYLATTKWNYQLSNGAAVYDNSVTTDIHKFAYSELEFDYRGSAEIRGHLGHQQDRKSFRFSESNGLLRVITFAENQWLNIFPITNLEPANSGINEDTTAPTTTNTTTTTPTTANSIKSPVSLTILQEDPDTKALKQISQLPNTQRPEPIGLPNEQLYASRFIGNRAYLVTFRTTDPLYVLDLSNPADPFIAGELKVDGYSDYLHPVSDTLLLGIGKDAIADDNASDPRGDAWYQGLKLSLIDVSDPTTPSEVDKIIIGKRGTESSALYNHHALSSLTVGNKQRISLPIKLHETKGIDNGEEAHPSEYYNYTQTGLYRFEVNIDNKRIEQLPALIINQSPDYSQETYTHNDRSVMINDHIHYLHNGKYWSQDWQGNDEIIGPK